MKRSLALPAVLSLFLGLPRDSLTVCTVDNAGDVVKPCGLLTVEACKVTQGGQQVSNETKIT